MSVESVEINIPEGFVLDDKGRLVPEKLIKAEVKLEDQLVRSVHVHAEELSAQISRFKAHTFDDVATFMDVLAEQYDKKKGGAKGNVTFKTFDGLRKVTVSIAEHMEFGAQLQIAKGLIDECIADWSADGRDEVKLLVNHAFSVDKPDKVNREAIFSLRKIEIEDERWKKAMAAIDDSIRITGSKTYIRFYERPAIDAPWQAITIDLASAKGGQS